MQVSELFYFTVIAGSRKFYKLPQKITGRPSKITSRSKFSQRCGRKHFHVTKTGPVMNGEGKKFRFLQLRTQKCRWEVHSVIFYITSRNLHNSVLVVKTIARWKGKSLGNPFRYFTSVFCNSFWWNMKFIMFRKLPARKDICSSVGSLAVCWFGWGQLNLNVASQFWILNHDPDVRYQDFVTFSVLSQLFIGLSMNKLHLITKSFVLTFYCVLFSIWNVKINKI